ncbi:glycosyltransferase family 4 protein [Flavobacterium aquatile]|uniref:Glycosyl transferase family 1 n=1 Tax=Flavobacterium aquatile LMG 4008 = ATCC 11947 TaxID=1453498 RepID=A0A095SSL3_9FLAO|nr:glycosyltransferase family 4 protein [Flavobacterium aquatile]KGD67601.1 hypothetical protein LG45_10745 [Flavobacterium aquatile LMG 4008 = ATCC 11947]OXA67464.1 glycosyltransferase [Flavobacterium aquatile] [Flavobacterium aquatile LMG 4008 = ATCC 11947]GEC79208.1 glycosyl transferase [Flavobacterium aquatile]
MKILYLTKYSRNGASSRLRSYQYFPLLKEKGLNVIVKPFFDEDYLIQLYSKKKISKLKISKFYFRRLYALLSIFKYDRVVIEKELFPYFFSWFEKILFLLNVKYIVDYDDAIFHNYDMSNSKLIHFFFKNKIGNVMKYSSCVLAGNDYLAKKARQSGANTVVIFPTVIDIKNYKIKENVTLNETVIIGWIGSPSTFKYVKNIAHILSKLQEKNPFELHIIGANENIAFKGKTIFPKWSEDTEIEQLSKMDIGIMPLENTPWELGKCSYKLIQYMGVGLPVVASSIGMNKEVIEHGINGFLVNNDQEWIDKLSILISDSTLRKHFGVYGRQKVEREYSLNNNIKKLIPILLNVRPK